jgi:branched-chain amino acid aminotransferase
MKLLRESEPQVTDGSIRIVVTNCNNLIHFSHGLMVPSDALETGVTASILNWERLDPHVKVFRDDYKAAVARKFSDITPYGPAFEVLLTDHKAQITEGSRSNFFVLFHGVVYSPPEKLILIGITRRYVLQAVRKAGLVYKESLFSLSDLARMRDETKDSSDSIALFITSSPFDILPLHSVDEEIFRSAQNSDLIRISEIYQEIVHQYIESRPADPIQQEC